jgi:hypothetical protein
MSMSEKDLQEILSRGAVRIHGEKAAIAAKVDIPTAKPQSRGKPNKSEMEYGKRLFYEFPDSEIVYEGLSFHLQNGHTYTPDWLVKHKDGAILLVEVKVRGKNGFRHASYQRARVMFDQSKIDFPMFSWRWAEKQGGEWG